MPTQCFDLHTYVKVDKCYLLHETEKEKYTHTLKHIYTHIQHSSSHNIQLLTAYQMTDADRAAGPSGQDSYSLLHCLMQVPSVS